MDVAYHKFAHQSWIEPRITTHGNILNYIFSDVQHFPAPHYIFVCLNADVLPTLLHSLCKKFPLRFQRKKQQNNTLITLDMKPCEAGCEKEAELR